MVKISIPERLRDGMMLKEANYFEVPSSPDGHEFMGWWQAAPADSRDSVMKLAYDKNVSVVEALHEHLSQE